MARASSTAPARIGEVDEAPVARECTGGDLASGEGQHHQVVAGEKLAARQHQQDEAEAEGEARRQPARPVAERAVGEYQRRHRAAEADVDAADESKQQEADRRQTGARNVSNLEAAGDLAGVERVERARWRLGVV
jgi:hypothetical protein